ncbi:ribosomal oxygenase 2 [Bombina bombina]|uniref:ribosomal oxygenase 2 n=1 Tax=Bombina bombina TaxID=8345 RepID=UPI00235B180D|nr:ribosomal oxygenase 2 [Bombina bombina]
MPRRGRKSMDTEDGDPVPSKVPRELELLYKSPLDFSSPTKLFESFIAPIKSEDFFAEYWEKKPLLIQRDQNDLGTYYQSLFKLSDLKHISSKGIFYGRDVNVCKCRNGKKMTLPRQGKATFLHLMKDFSSGKATIQFHQPQRFSDELWHIMEKLECFFGALVGSNVYITPPDSQGLPPHYDDVEVFILQLEGEKHWCLYEPKVHLAREYNVEPEGTIGAPTLDLILKPGDMLYFPRGTIHQARTPAGSSHSTHVTISTYQNNTWADYLQDLIPGLLFDSSKDNIDLRRGLPRQLLMQTDPSDCAEKISSLLTDLVKRLQTKKDIRPFEMVRDFMGNRLPPYMNADAGHKEDATGGVLPKLNSTIKLKYKDYTTLSVQHVADSDDSSTQRMVFVYHAMRNGREQHMMNTHDESLNVNGLRFSLSHIDALKEIWREEPICVNNLPLESDRDKENLAISLWTEGLLAVTP